ncbi:DUF4897 domain-containing protein [Natronorubrum sp. JWXQ-INN-674]|uniref:DUF4897 domain-containing protein n=1 Tax=Natronorubrum halalkaliphilum TaxID=2691917 RepID=A0A6B0VGL3_9EURY|nr:DUF4897 domain-containing protein [Natronorubrum halalkaliphilum]MXV60668.1 DUF4897 domain-containing protein [Natronorubrum halalkaliphilum]
MRRAFGVTLVVSMLLVSGLAMPVAGSSAVTDESINGPAVHVALEADGDATVTLVSVYDLTDEDERDAFETLREDEKTQADLLERFSERLEGVADDVDTDADREKSVESKSVDVRTNEDSGIVTFSAFWDELAAVEGETVVLMEPFASGFESDRSLIVTIPDGTTIESVTPEPTIHEESAVNWDGETELDGFELTASTATNDESSVDASETTTDGVPGFGPIGAIVALATLLVAISASRR